MKVWATHDAIELPTAAFIRQFERFLGAIEQAPDSEGPFESFQTGVALRDEGYKEWVYHEARRRLAAKDWKPSDIGSGRILDRVVAAIEIKEGKDHRNNLVNWEPRRGLEARSHHRLCLQRDDTGALPGTERLFYAFYHERCSPKDAFESFVKQFGQRYDLIAYLLFLRDWGHYLPISPTTFEKAFALLGVPLKLSHRCGWQNYREYLRRLGAVRQRLEGFGIPGVRPIDAHSFCWIMARYEDPACPKPARAASFVRFHPEAGRFPDRIPATTAQDQTVDFDRQNLLRRRIGDQAQRIVLESEQRRLRELGRSDLADHVVDVSHFPARGYDIASFTSDGEPKPIEVKAAAKRGDALRFFLSENEKARSVELENYTFALVVDVDSQSPKIYEFPGPELPTAALRPTHYEARLSIPQPR